MLLIAFWLLLIAAVGGLAMGVLGVAVPAMRLGHGAIAALGLLALLVGALMQGSLLLWSAFGLIAVGFGAGATLFGVVWKDRAPPRLVVAAHGLINAAGVLALGVAVFG